MGNASNPIRNMDKRTSRREYKSNFVGAIDNYRRIHAKAGKAIPLSNSPLTGDLNIRVFVRKRPIFKHELDNSEFDVCSCIGDQTVVIHDARMHMDMKKMLMNHHEFQFDRVFGENATNDFVYAQSAKPLVNIAILGGYATCLVYGQTGSGKTFTMSSIYKNAAHDIFSEIDNTTARFSVPPVISVSFCEISGDDCSDLLNGFQATQLLTSGDGSVQAFPLVEPTVTSADELLAMIQHGVSIRSTAATGVHDSSSRSHAILRIYIRRTSSDGAPQKLQSEGTLTLVDLAGTEHKIDSM
jgi:kinesin family protein 2/24